MSFSNRKMICVIKKKKNRDQTNKESYIIKVFKNGRKLKKKMKIFYILINSFYLFRYSDI